MLNFFRKYPLAYALIFGIIFALLVLKVTVTFTAGNLLLGTLLFVITGMFQVGGLKFYQYKIYNHIAAQEKSPE